MRGLATEQYSRGGADGGVAAARTEPLKSELSMEQLRALESEAIHIFREVAAEFERPVLLFSGGKDSIVTRSTSRSLK